MEIIKYKKGRDNIYELELDNGTIIKLFDDIIIKYGLLLNKSIDNKELEKIVKENENMSAYYLSLKYLNKKMRSQLEIEKFLQKKEFSSEVINLTIKKIKDSGYLDNKSYIKSYINDQINLTNNGPDKIKHSLIKLGFNEEEINIEYDFDEKIRNLIDKKVKLNHKLNTNSLKMNITNYLINLGYPKDMFSEYLIDISVNDKGLIQKDYDLLLKKYQKKYDSNKLKLFIRDKLFRKGYNIEEINEVMNDVY